MKTKSFRSEDDRIATMINRSDSRPMTPEQEREASEWIARRVAILRASYIGHPGKDNEGARILFMRARMNCELLTPGLLLTPRATQNKILAMRAEGCSYGKIRKATGCSNTAIRNTLKRAGARVHKSA